MECRAIGETEMELSRTFMDTPARSLKGKTLGRFSATCVARSVETGPLRFNMWRVSTSQEVMSISVTNVTRSLIPKASGEFIAQQCTPARSQSECWCALHNENLHVLQITVDSKQMYNVHVSVIVKATLILDFSLKFCAALADCLI